MISVLDYNAGAAPSVQRALVDIRRGSGYRDTASDLVRLARTYVEKGWIFENSPQATGRAGAR